MKLSSLECGYKNFKDYLVLGDDVVIFNNEVADKYEELMNGIGVEISKHKCVESNSSHLSLEFASRIFLNGVELSPLPIGLILAKDRVSSLIRL